ncbi:ATP-binding protein [Streptomyces sp. NPDC012769]|uniref:ATP-binding protein n=1 Tax=Streptomyces sp. NPDC012769 TaxID=3364848 RepID=UPI0036ABA1F1
MRRGDTAGTGNTGHTSHTSHDGYSGHSGHARDSGGLEGAGNLAQGQVRRLLLHGAGGAVTRCRDFTAAALTDWGWLPGTTPEERERAEDVLLMVSEVVTNACLHAGGPEQLVLRQSEGHLRVEVYDGNPASPRSDVPRSPSLPGGHGLMVLDRLAGAWGAAAKDDGAPGKVVWLEVALPSAPPWGREDRPGV